MNLNDLERQLYISKNPADWEKAKLIEEVIEVVEQADEPCARCYHFDDADILSEAARFAIRGLGEAIDKLKASRWAAKKESQLVILAYAELEGEI